MPSAEENRSYTSRETANKACIFAVKEIELCSRLFGNIITLPSNKISFVE